MYDHPLLNSVSFPPPPPNKSNSWMSTWFYLLFIWSNFFYVDVSGNPVTETIQSVVVTDASGNPVTGIL